MDKDEVRACLRALLSSSVFSYTLRSLLNDFRTQTGFELPLFGCATPVEFLRTLSDTVQLIGDPLNPEVALVESKKSAHIISLVDRQRSNSSHTRHPSGLFGHRRLIIPDRNKTFNDAKGVKNLFSDPPLQRASEATSQSNFFNFGSSFQNRPKAAEHRSQVFIFGSNDPNQETDRRLLPLKTEAVDSFNGKSHSTPNQKNLDNEKPKIEKPVESPEEKTENCYFEDISDIEDSYDNCEDAKNNSESVVNEGLKNKFRKLLKNYPDGFWCCELPELFLKEYKFALDYREFGYTSLIKMLSELSDVFRCVRPGNGDWILFDASTPPGPLEKKMKDLELGAEINCEIKRNLQKLLFSCFEKEYQMELNKVLYLYKEMFGSSLDFQSLGFKDLKSLLKIWEGSFLNILEIDGKDFIVPGLKRTVHSMIRREEAIPPITEENDIFVEIFPKDVVGPDEGPSELNLMRHVAVGNVVEVCVAEVWSPKTFYLQLNKFKRPLNRFMDELQNFYNLYLNKYKMPDSTIRPRQMCVGLYNSDSESPEEWHRAQIVQVINEKTVLINFVDYGTLARVKKSQLRFLHRNFQSFPVQAFSAQLSGIVPPNNESKWPLSTSKKFLELTRVPCLKAEITDIDFKIPRFSVILFEHLKKSTVSINQKLVLEKLACLRAEPTFEDLLQSPETKPEMTVQDSNPAEDQKDAVSDESSDVSTQENTTKNIPEQNDAFSDIADLGQTTLFHFKMKRTSLLDSSLSRKESETNKMLTDSRVSFEFEEVPDLEKDWKEGKNKVTEEEPTKEEIHKSELFENEENSTGVKGASLLQQKTRNSSSLDEKFKKPAPPQEVATPQLPSVLSSKPNRLPPGLEHMNILPGFNEVQFFLQPEEFKKRVNILAMELLSTKPSIKLVGMNNPALALEIATEMAEVYVASQFTGRVPFGLNPLSAHPFPNSLVPPLRLQPSVFGEKAPTLSGVSGFTIPLPVPKPTETTIPEKEDFILLQREKPQTSPVKGKKVNEHLEVRQIAGKTLHLVRVDDQTYFHGDEIIRNFSTISDRVTADLALHRKKFQTNYRIITKGTDEKVFKAIKNELGIVWKGKLNRLKIHLIPSADVLPFLQALGVKTEAFEKDFVELQCTGKEEKKGKKKVF